MIKTRFAPSPTGHLHIGGARTALFNWLYARHNKGKFVLRVEDTDRERSKPEFADAILEGMKWLGLDWDEDPYYQSERNVLYQKQIEKMLGKGKAYRCYCSPEELDRKRAEAMAEGRKPKYDGTCRNLKPDLGRKGPFTLRFKGPETGVTVIEDMIKGRVAFDNAEMDDLIIARSDGTPTYNFVVVVDDATMRITHIIRGDDHLNNTPRQVLLYDALGFKPPVFGHLPLILGPDKKRLSKRHGATSVTAYREAGYLPHALINYLARLGWSFGDQEIFTIDELKDCFNTNQIGKSAGIFNAEKLLWLNAHYIKETSKENLGELLAPFLVEQGIDLSDGPEIETVADILKERAKTLVEMAEIAKIYYIDEVDIDEEAACKMLSGEKAQLLREIAEGIKGIDPFTEEGIAHFFKIFMEEKGLKMGKVAQPVRFALTGGAASPGIFEVISLIGRKRTLLRLNKATALALEIEG